MKIHEASLAIAVLAFGTAAFAQSARPGSVREAGDMHLLSPSAALLGLGVCNESQHLGEIGDLLIDPSSGEIRYAVLEVGGMIGMGEDERVVPWAFLRIVPDEKEPHRVHARTNLTEAQVKDAPKCKKDQVFDAEFGGRIEATFGKDEAWPFDGDGQPPFARLTQMDGVLVKDLANKEVGTVQDLILAPQNGCVAYSIVDTTEEAGNKDVALPWSRLQFEYDGNNELMASTPVEIAHLQNAPEFDRNDWERMSSMAWMNELSTYYDCAPFWETSRFASARKLP